MTSWWHLASVIWCVSASNRVDGGRWGDSNVVNNWIAGVTLKKNQKLEEDSKGSNHITRAEHLSFPRGLLVNHHKVLPPDYPGQSYKINNFWPFTDVRFLNDKRQGLDGEHEEPSSPDL